MTDVNLEEVVPEPYISSKDRDPTIWLSLKLFFYDMDDDNLLLTSRCDDVNLKKLAKAELRRRLRKELRRNK